MANSELSASLQLLNQLLEARLGLSVGTGGIRPTPPTGTTGTCPPNAPQTIRDVLCSLVGEQVEITTPFEVITGTLIALESDYIVMIESDGSEVLVRINSIESVNEL